jgi:hypothetical protein
MVPLFGNGVRCNKFRRRNVQIASMHHDDLDGGAKKILAEIP